MQEPKRLGAHDAWTFMLAVPGGAAPPPLLSARYTLVRASASGAGAGAELTTRAA
jgi:hypothetical protein